VILNASTAANITIFTSQKTVNLSVNLRIRKSFTNIFKGRKHMAKNTIWDTCRKEGFLLKMAEKSVK